MHQDLLTIRDVSATHADVLISFLLETHALVLVPGLAHLLVHSCLDLVGAHEVAPGLDLPFHLSEFAFGCGAGLGIHDVLTKLEPIEIDRTQCK